MFLGSRSSHIYIANTAHFQASDIVLCKLEHTVMWKRTFHSNVVLKWHHSKQDTITNDMAGLLDRMRFEQTHGEHCKNNCSLGDKSQRHDMPSFQRTNCKCVLGLIS